MGCTKFVLDMKIVSDSFSKMKNGIAARPLRKCEKKRENRNQHNRPDERIVHMGVSPPPD